jgi:predicted enzyme related to lactoylglutathione lyase
MSASHGRFVWYELWTTDPEAAEAYYCDVIGWGAQPVPAGPGGPYTLFTAGETPVCGLMKRPEPATGQNAPPTWLGHVLVDDVDAAARQAQHLGATVHLEPLDIPNVCRLSIIGDPQMATIGMMAWAQPQKDAPPGAALLPGRIGWHELLTTDWEKGYDFYRTLFGWQKADALAVDEIGTYQVFATGGQPVGGMFNKPAVIPATFWLYYFNVSDFDAAVGRITACGGVIVYGPMEVPGGGWVVHAQDPQGAVFALVGQRG